MLFFDDHSSLDPLGRDSLDLGEQLRVHGDAFPEILTIQTIDLGHLDRDHACDSPLVGN